MADLCGSRYRPLPAARPWARAVKEAGKTSLPIRRLGVFDRSILLPSEGRLILLLDAGALTNTMPSNVTTEKLVISYLEK